MGKAGQGVGICLNGDWREGESMDKIDEFLNSLPEGRCNPCDYAKCVVATGHYMFLGCYCAEDKLTK